MADKVTVMILKVDLHCSSCYKKIKRLLCKFPQIRDQIYDEKQNQVMITVVCCSPEKIRDKLCCKGGKVIKSIEIKEPPKPKEQEKPKTPEKPKEPEKPKTPEKPKEPEKPKTPEKPKEAEKPKEPAAPAPPKPVQDPHRVHVEVQYGHPPPFPNWGCCGPCSQGLPGGPCYHGGYGVAPPSPPRPICDGYGYYGGGGNRGCYVSRCEYFSEENPQGCRIM